MNRAHLHLLVNHFPILIPVIACLVLFAGLWLKSALIKRVAFALFMLGALMTLPASFTGDGAEHSIFFMPGIEKHRIHVHEEKADVFSTLSYLLGVLSLLAFYFNYRRHKWMLPAQWVVVVLAVVVLIFAQQTGNTGGEIRHTEIRDSSATAPLHN